MDRNEKPRLRFTEEEAPAGTTGNAEHPAPCASPEFTMKPLASRTRPRLSEEKDAQNPGKPPGGLSKQKRLAIARAADEATGKTRLRFDEPPKPSSRLTYEPLPGVGGEVHRQINRVEEENSGVQAAHGAERLSEGGLRLAARSSRAAKLKAYRHAQQAEQKLDKAHLRTLYRQEPLSSHPLSRWQQKRAIRRGYLEGKAAAQSTAQAKGFAARAKQAGQALVKRNKKPILLGGALFLLIAFVMNGLSSCAPLVQGALQAVVIATYPAEDADILAAERYYKNRENELREEIERYASSHPQYDEYRYELDEIWHDPHALISLVSAHANGEWSAQRAYSYLDRLFEKQYTLSQKVVSETRCRKEWVTRHSKEIDEETGEITWIPYQVEEEVPYTYRICTITLDNFNLSHLPFYVLSRVGVGRYAMYIAVLGNREDLFRGHPHASKLREPGRHDVPEAYLEDETFRRILEEAEKYIGYPYVWGGDSPETSFDCSGFVSFVFTHSGVRNVGRLGATSLYATCQKITPEEAKPGDLIFFEGTISGEDGITHCGIYVGDNHMLHCGSPIGYADLTESYWKRHYYGYGRLAD